MYLRTWDKIAAQRPDTYIAISQEVQKRIKKYYGRESKVIYPPLSLPHCEPIGIRMHDKGFLLVVSRLVSAKRIDIAIEACNKLQLPLKIIGAGFDFKRLKRLSGQTISFPGSLTDKELVGYYNGCSALIFPGVEDFGLTALEAQACGKPVIAYKSGGVLETVIPGKTGEFFYPQTAQSLADILSKLIKSGKVSLKSSEQTYYKNACIEQAGKFTKEKFKRELREYIEKIKKQK